MTRQLPRLAVALLLAGLGAACKRHGTAVCELPPPQPSALPTEAIAFGVKNAGQTVTFDVPAGTASVTIVEQGASSTIPLTVAGSGQLFPNTPVPLAIDVSGVGQIFYDVPMPPDAAFHALPPSGLTVLEPLSDSILSVYFYSAGAWTGALTLPNTSVVIPGTDTLAGDGVPAGTWTVTVGDWAYECSHFSFLGCSATSTPSVYDVTVILKPVAAPPDALKVVFYLVTTSGLTASNASSNADVRRLEWAITQILAGAGITPAFQYRDVPASVRLHYATGVDASSGGACGTMDQLLTYAGPGNQLNVFLVDLIRDTATGSFSTVGLDPIVPGPASFGGTPASGVLVSMEYLGKIVTGSSGCVPGQLSIGTCGDDVTASIVAHEAGHFLGLQHTTEGIGTIVDPIADTATCFCPLCAPTADVGQCQGLAATDPQIKSPYQMLVTDCLAPAGSTPECGGGDNLMFWLIDTDSKGLLTAGQGAVMRASPLVQ